MTKMEIYRIKVLKKQTINSILTKASRLKSTYKRAYPSKL